MSDYRRRFVLYTMLLIGVVLIIAFAALAIYMYRSQLSELEKTMSLVVEPLDMPSGPGNRPQQGDDRPPSPGGDGGEHGEPPDGEPPEGDRPGRRASDEGILTVFYNAVTDEISMISSRLTIDEDTVRSAVEAIVANGGGFGRLKEQRLFYRCENNLQGGGGNSVYKIALADASYITSRTVRSLLLLAAVFAAVMGLLFAVSLRLSKLAAKPMEDAMRMERQFVQDLSHDLKTPVTVVLANNSILRSNPEARVGEQEQWIASTDSACRDMMELVNSMLTLSQLDSDSEKRSQSRAAAPLSPVDLSEAAEKCVLQMESVAYDRGVTLESDIPAGLLARTTEQGAEKIASGLIENALKYEPDGGKVAVSLKRSPKNRRRLLLTVQNFGSFIEPEDLPHIFERFYRGDKARSEQGHGLGLPILKRTAELAGAELTVSSSRENGTVFTAAFDSAE